MPRSVRARNTKRDFDVKRLILPSLAAFLFSLSAPGQLKAVWVVVKQNDFAGHDAYSVMTESDFRALDGELSKESFLAARARIMATRAWEKDDTKEGRFPAGMISLRRASKVGRPYDDRTEAESKQAKIEKLIEDKKRDSKRTEKRREENRSRATESAIRSRSSGNSRNSSNREAERRALDNLKEHEQEKRMDKEEREMKRDAILTEAVTIYAAQIDLLKNPPLTESPAP